MMSILYFLRNLFRKKKRDVIKRKEAEFGKDISEYLYERPKEQFLNFRKQQLEGKIFINGVNRIRIIKKAQSHNPKYLKYQTQSL